MAYCEVPLWVDKTMINISKFPLLEKNCPKNANSTATMVNVGDFSMNYDNNSDIQVTFTLTGNKIVWPRGSPPKDSPECGFNNKKCAPKSTDTESGKTMSKLLLFSCMYLAHEQLGVSEASLNSCNVA